MGGSFSIQQHMDWSVLNHSLQLLKFYSPPLFSWCPTKEIHPHHDSLKGPTDKPLHVFLLGARLPAKMARPICDTKLMQGKNPVHVQGEDYLRSVKITCTRKGWRGHLDETKTPNHDHWAVSFHPH